VGNAIKTATGVTAFHHLGTAMMQRTGGQISVIRHELAESVCDP
jgi:hypothetical protein